MNYHQYDRHLSVWCEGVGVAMCPSWCWLKARGGCGYVPLVVLAEGQRWVQLCAPRGAGSRPGVGVAMCPSWCWLKARGWCGYVPLVVLAQGQGLVWLCAPRGAGSRPGVGAAVCPSWCWLKARGWCGYVPLVVLAQGQRWVRLCAPCGAGSRPGVGVAQGQDGVAMCPSWCWPKAGGGCGCVPLVVLAQGQGWVRQAEQARSCYQIGFHCLECTCHMIVILQCTGVPPSYRTPMR